MRLVDEFYKKILSTIDLLSAILLAMISDAGFLCPGELRVAVVAGGGIFASSLTPG